jgi:uncharacterized protein (DUF2147 family)
MANQLLIGLTAMLLFAGAVKAPGTAASEQICGKWQSVDKNLVIAVYKENNEFRAKIVWFDDDDDSKEMDYWTDKRNPDPALRTRKILGMNVLEKLIYDSKNNSWEDGMIYDATHGRSWNSSAYINKEGLLKVKGYWHFKFIGKTLTFKRM